LELDFVKLCDYKPRFCATELSLLEYRLVYGLNQKSICIVDYEWESEKRELNKICAIFNGLLKKFKLNIEIINDEIDETFIEKQ
jgi:hypothetical protein